MFFDYIKVELFMGLTGLLSDENFNKQTKI
jgi:hypothetical protein